MAPKKQPPPTEEIPPYERSMYRQLNAMRKRILDERETPKKRRKAS